MFAHNNARLVHATSRQWLLAAPMLVGLLVVPRVAPGAVQAAPAVDPPALTALCATGAAGAAEPNSDASQAEPVDAPAAVSAAGCLAICGVPDSL
jgi:hypothetical protein